MKSINLRRVFIAVGLTGLVIIYTAIWVRMIITPAEHTGSDFISAYTGGRVANLWGAKKVYNLDYQQRVQEEVLGFELDPGQVLMFNHPPYLVPLLALLMDGNYIASLVRYTLVMVALYAVSLATAWRLLRLEGWRRGPAALVLAGLGTFYPLFVSLVNTQDTALMVLGGLFCFFGLLTGRDWLAGLGLALTTVRPHVTVLLAVPFLFKRQRVFLWFCVASALLGLVSLLVVGPGGMQAYLRLLLTVSGGQFYGMHETAMVNLIGLLWRIEPDLGSLVIHWVGWGVYTLTLAGLCVLWKFGKEIAEKQIGTAVVLAVFTVPHLHYHDLTLLLVTLIASLLVLVRGKYLSAREACLAPLLVSLALLFSSLVPGLQFNFPYLVMLLMVLVLWFSQRIFGWRRIKMEVP